jgi:hypothetical protein
MNEGSKLVGGALTVMKIIVFFGKYKINKNCKKHLVRRKKMTLKPSCGARG